MDKDSLLEFGCSVLIALAILAFIVFGVFMGIQDKSFGDMLEKEAFHRCVLQEESNNFRAFAEGIRE